MVVDGIDVIVIDGGMCGADWVIAVVVMLVDLASERGRGRDHFGRVGRGWCQCWRGVDVTVWPTLSWS